jgi:predicted Zn-dependent peptidase
VDKVHDPVLRETLYREVLPSGLTVYVFPKPGFQKRFATLSARYGSIDNRFVPPGTDEVVEVPDGIAHFLEHKLFEEEDGNASDRFSDIGASHNAFTNQTTTTYLFSATENFDAGVKILMEFVQNPYFTPENVEKEKGIIEQELRMYMDDPHWHVFQRLMEAMFQNHPVRVDVGGTVESIRKITVPMLEGCYRTFYHPHNMTFFAVGDVNPEQLVDLLASLSPVPAAGAGEIRRLYPQEPPEPARRWTEETLVVARPLVSIGFKERSPATDAAEYLRREVETGLLLEILFGRSAPLFDDLYRDGLVDDRFGGFYFGHPEFAATIVGGETPDPEALAERIRQALAAAATEAVGAEAFDRARRRALGEFVGLFDSPEAVATAFTDFHFKGVSLFAYRRALAEVSREALQRRIEEHLNPDRMVVSVVRPAASA